MRLALTHVVLARRPTALGWGAFLLVTVLLAALFVAGLYPFLAPTRPPHEGIMVVEGWIHDFALDEAVALYRAGGHDRIVCTGVPIETGSYIQAFQSYPEMTAARLKKTGVPEEQIVTAIAYTSKKDRTYAAAVALREALMAYNIKETDLHLITTGPHGRRSRMLFQKALGDEYNIGITCLDPASYEPESWYTCSEGVRNTMGEFIAYAYAGLFFHP